MLKDPKKLLLINMNRLFFKDIRIVLLLPILLFLIAGCDKKCSNDDADLITCYYHNGNSWVPDQPYCSNEEAPCNCKNENGELITNQFPGVFGDCADEPFNLVVDEPYHYYQEHLVGNSLVVDNPDGVSYTYYDDSEGSADKSNRPLYIRYSISGSDLSAYTYSVKLYDGPSNLLSEAVLDKDYFNPYVIRNIAPGNCKNCDIQVTAKLNLAGLSSGNNMPVVMLYRKNKQTGKEELLISRHIGILKYDTENKLNQRLFRIVPFYDNLYNALSYETLNNNIPFGDALHSVFGTDHSNIKLDVQPKAFTSSMKYDIKDHNIMLDKNFIITGSNGNDVSEALFNWSSELYFLAYGTNENPKSTGAIALESYYFNGYDFSVSPAKPLQTKEAAYTLYSRDYVAALGVTYPYPTAIVCITFRHAKHYEKMLSTSEISDSEFMNSLALGTYFHELGHAWSVKGYLGLSDNGDLNCYEHQYYCSGKNVDYCLWACPSGKETSGTHYKKRSAIMSFCERHKYIFMNGFSLRN